LPSRRFFFAGDKPNYVCSKGLWIIFPSHFPFKSAGSINFTHTFHLSKFILDVAFMTKKKREKEKVSDATC